jgi:hypothetical protein
MKVKHVMELLGRENPEEEVVFILDDNTSEYYVLEFKPFLHAGPKSFYNKKKDVVRASVVLIKAKKYKRPE